jgi:hypothetical protein
MTSATPSIRERYPNEQRLPYHTQFRTPLKLRPQTEANWGADFSYENITEGTRIVLVYTYDEHKSLIGKKAPTP